MSATNSSKDSSDEESQESCGKKRKCAVSSNRHDMDSSVGGNREAAGGGMVAEENHQVNANATMQKEESSATKMKARLNHYGRWNRLFMELVKYKEKNGHCNFPTTNGSFGRWIRLQRTLFRSKELKADRYAKLAGIGFVFEDVKFTIDNERWNVRFLELVKYKQKNGHCNCPRTNGSFAHWISTQRTLFRSKKLKEDRYEKLVGIGFA
jgi:hypothetical protein